MSRVVRNNREYPQLLADCHTTTNSRINPSLIQCAQAIQPRPRRNRQKLLPYKDALLNLAEPDVPYRKKNHIRVQEADGFIQELLTPILSSMGFLLL